MPSNKYQTASGGTRWRCTFYYRDYTGKNVKKKKSGFSTKREADAWERDFLGKMSGSPSMKFSHLVENYFEDARHRLKPISYVHTRMMVKNHVLPTFGDMQLDAITPAAVRAWETKLPQESGLAASSCGQVITYLSALFNFAVRFYGLPSNPVRLAGPVQRRAAHMESSDGGRLHFWTVEQFDRFILSDMMPEYILLYSVLFWTGCRVGEARALRVEDVDVDARTIRICKTLSFVSPMTYIIQCPKTSSSVRTVTIPRHLAAMLGDWIRTLQPTKPATLLFSLTHAPNINNMMRAHAKAAGLPQIRVHDLRHSHASMLVNMGLPPMVIRERLGHKDIQTTLNVYSHLYPKKMDDVADALEHVR